MKKILILGISLVLIFSGCSLTEPKTVSEVLGMEEASAKVKEFINNNLLAPGSEAEIKEDGEEFGLYKYNVYLQTGQEVVAYMSKDGKKFFPQVINMEEMENEIQAEASPAPVANAPKNDKPKVELFVMSYCPYGIQIEKGILPVVETLGGKIDFELKFCDYVMKDKKELDEQLIQHCIQKNETDKLIKYLNCFLASGDTASCLKTAGINQVNLNSCVKAVDKEFKVTEMYNDKSTWRGDRFPIFNVNGADVKKYGVQGSPTLVINETVISSGRDSASLLSVICAAFNNPPEECGKTLSSASPSPAFGTETGVDAGGECY